MTGIRCIFLLTVLVSCQAAFQNPPCDNNCVFMAPQGGIPLMLTCEYNPQLKREACACKSDRNRMLMDAPFYPVELRDGECTVGDRAPCGVNNGIEITCRDGSQCLQGKCRDTKNFGKTPLHHSCVDTQDCVAGLECKMTRFSFQPYYSCVDPNTPNFDPNGPRPPPGKK